MYKAIAIVAAVAAVSLPAVALPTAAQANQIDHTLTLCFDGADVDATNPLTLVANGPSFMTFTVNADEDCASANVLPGQYQISFFGETPATHFTNYTIARDGADAISVDQPTILTDVTGDNYNSTTETVTLVAAAG